MSAGTHTIASVVARFIAAHGAGPVFTLPGSSCLSLLTCIDAEGPSVVLMRGETAAVHAAHGSAFGRTSGFGCAVLSRGPGAINGLCGFVTADEGFPVLVVVGDNAVGFRGSRQVTQDVDLYSAFRAVGNVAVLDHPGKITPVIRQLAQYLLVERASAALIIPSDVQTALVTADGDAGITIGDPTPRSNPPSTHAAARLNDALSGIHRPFVLWGRDVLVDPGCRRQIEQFLAAGHHVHSAVTYRGLSFLPHGCRGLVGTQGRAADNRLLASCDAVVVIGEQILHEAIGSWPSILGRHRVIVCHSHGKLLLGGPPHTEIAIGPADLAPILQLLRGFETEKPERTTEEVPLPLVSTLAQLISAAPANAALCLDSGENFFASCFALLESEHQPPVVASVSQGTMGFALPAAIGWASAHGAPAIAITGDAGLLMALGELVTVIENGLDVKVVVVNNGGLAMVRRSQLRRKLPELATATSRLDFTTVSRALNVDAAAVRDLTDLDKAIALIHQPGPALIDVECEAGAAGLPEGGAGKELPV